MKAVECEHLQFQYGERPALRDLTFDIEQGEYVAVAGRNGCGKSTLARHINALLQPTEGVMRVFGMDTKDESKTLEIRKRAGMIFQNPDNQIVASVVEEDVAFGPENLGVPTEEIRKRVDQALAQTGMTSFAKRAPHTLSGGQKQRVAIARALMRHPAILLADEPVASLDPVTGRQILGLLKSIHETDGVTILMNSHNLEFSQEFSDRLIGLKDGKVVFDGKTADLTDSITTQIYNKNDTQIENKRGVAYE